MSTRTFGSTGARLPAIGQGTWRMEADDPAACIASLRRGFERGLLHLDTAELYGSGVVEEKVVAPALEGWREKVYLVSKVIPSNASYEGTLRACERSLSRMGVSHLDLYLLHWPGPHPFAETLRAFEKLQKDGKIRAYGVSNFDVEELEEAVSLAGPGKIACNQVLYHLKERAIEHRVLPACRRHGVPVVGYSPFGAGPFVSPRSHGFAVLSEVARAHRATERQVALAFLTRDPDLFTIPKAAAVAKTEDNAGALTLTLSTDELAKIDAAFPLGRAQALPTI